MTKPNKSRTMHPVPNRAPRSTVKEVEDLLARKKSLQDARRPWESHWQDLAELMRPRRADFTHEPVDGEKRAGTIFDGTPMQAARMLAASLDGLLKPKSSRWFHIKATDHDLNDDEAAKAG